MSDKIQLKYEASNGDIVNAYPDTKAEYVNFQDGKTLAEKMKDVSKSHIHDLANASSNGFMSSADKLKLDNMSNYSHPANHPASIITQDPNNKLVTQDQINSWNDKANNETATGTSNGLLSYQDKIKLDGLENYVHPDDNYSQHVTLAEKSDIAKIKDFLARLTEVEILFDDVVNQNIFEVTPTDIQDIIDMVGV